jgi:hypothetical protein
MAVPVPSRNAEETATSRRFAHARPGLAGGRSGFDRAAPRVRPQTACAP